MGYYIGPGLGQDPATIAMAGKETANIFKSIIGAFSKRARVKTETAAIADQGFPVLRDIAARFLRGDLTKTAALYLLDELWDEMVSLWREYDRANRTTQGARSITSQRVYFDQIRNKVLSTPDTSAQRAAAAGGATPSAGAPNGGITGMLPLVVAAGAAYFLL